MEETLGPTTTQEPVQPPEPPRHRKVQRRKTRRPKLSAHVLATKKARRTTLTKELRGATVQLTVAPSGLMNLSVTLNLEGGTP